MVRSTSPIRTVLASLLLVSTCGGLVSTTLAHAALGACRSDPIVLLSDGTTVQLYSDVYDAPANVANVSYVLYAPVGTTVVSIAYPSDMAAAVPETFQLIADGKDGKYQATTYVSDANSNVQMTTYAVATASDGTVSKTFQHNGHVNQLVKLDVKLDTKPAKLPK